MRVDKTSCKVGAYGPFIWPYGTVNLCENQFSLFYLYSQLTQQAHLRKLLHLLNLRPFLYLVFASVPNHAHHDTARRLGHLLEKYPAHRARKCLSRRLP
jgi:hypothetical protein